MSVVELVDDERPAVKDDGDPVCRGVLKAVRMHGALTSWAIAKATGRSQRSIQGVLGDLIHKGRLKALDIRRRRHYLVATTPLLECECDGKCFQQIRELSDPVQRWLYDKIRQHGTVRLCELATDGAEELGLSERSVRRRMDRLAAVDLVRKQRDPDDLRGIIYQAVAPTAVAQAAMQD